MTFEITNKDAMGRIGKLKTPHGRVETPTLMPVINPNIDFIPAEKMKRFGAQILITNSYIIYRSGDLRDMAVEKGLHRLLETDLPVMTDSGSYQLMIYGDVEVKNAEVVKFQQMIGSDIIVPLDIPTPPDADYSRAIADLEITIEREREASRLIKESNSENLLAIPIQGSTYSELRKRSAEESKKIDGDVYPIGGVVPLLDDYRFSDVVRIILDVKSVIPSSYPIHLFGAGHPIFLSIAVALGCDLFDSAAYALYAKDDRYLTPYGTKKLNELHCLPCSCPVCSQYSAEELLKIEKEEREILVGEHNLWISFEEIRKIKQAIKENSLFEFVEKRIRSHPSLLSSWRQIKNYSTLLEEYDPSTKRQFFYTGIESIYRPAVSRHHERVKNVELEKDEYTISTSSENNSDFYLKPVFGVVPAEMNEVYPAGHAEMPPVEYIENEAVDVAVNALRSFLRKHHDKKFIIRADGVWREYLIELPDNAVVE
ncbi:MAG TPA: tRNA guanosine(15) transglycosylase TgtA [Archaeoglobaceae archaeon]|nr:tRNA guanosine(15) transglycosylase TgtA [Archaeoglobaceae archaeon]